MTSPARRARGRQTQAAVAEFMRTWWPSAESGPASIPGSDILGLGALADVEVKSSADDNPSPLAALRQAHKRPGAFHMVVIRPRGYGPEKRAEWPATFTFQEGCELLALAQWALDHGAQLRRAA